jgi:hypothetical protein
MAQYRVYNIVPKPESKGILDAMERLTADRQERAERKEAERAAGDPRGDGRLGAVPEARPASPTKGKKSKTGDELDFTDVWS